MGSNNNGSVIYRSKEYKSIKELALAYGIQPTTLYRMYDYIGHRNLEQLDLEEIGKEDTFKVLLSNGMKKILYTYLGIESNTYCITKVEENVYNISFRFNANRRDKIIDCLSKNFRIHKNKIKKYSRRHIIKYEGLSRDDLKNIIVLSKLI